MRSAIDWGVLLHRSRWRHNLETAIRLAAHPARPDKTDSSVSGSALSPKVRLRCRYRSRLPGAKMKLAPSWKGFLPSRCWRWPPRLAWARASAFSLRRRWSRFADFNSRGAIGSSFGIDQEREGDAGLLAKQARVVHIAEADCGQRGSGLLELALVFAQLRDVLAAEDSTIVAQKNYHGGMLLPERA